MSMLFDKGEGESKRTAPEPVKEEPSIRVNYQPDSIEIFAVLTEGYECKDDRCNCSVFDVVNVDKGFWLITCWECGTGQWVPQQQELLEKESDDDFKFHGGQMDGKTIAEVRQTSRGESYLKWAAKKHPRKYVREKCQAAIDEQGG